MTFAEQLQRLTEDRIKSKLSLRAGLPATAINDYIAKGHLPNAVKALRLARALGVSLEWLVDNDQSWPPVPAAAERVGAAA